MASTSKRLWSVRLPEEGGELGLAAFFERDGQTNILVAFKGMKAYVLAAKDGRILASFTYGKPETDAEQRAYKRKFGLKAEIGDPSLSFFPASLAFDSSRNLLACGALDGKRVRVLSVDQPHALVFEAHSNDNPQSPRGGNWTVESLRFGGSGEYLTAEYEFGSRLTMKRLTVAEVFDTRTWRVVWSDEESGRSTARAPQISPGGKVMALVKHERLEIRPFLPSRGNDTTSPR